MDAYRIVGFHNTPYVTGRRVNVETEILPYASVAVAKQISHNSSQYRSLRVFNFFYNYSLQCTYTIQKNSTAERVEVKKRERRWRKVHERSNPRWV